MYTSIESCTQTHSMHIYIHHIPAGAVPCKMDKWIIAINPNSGSQLLTHLSHQSLHTCEWVKSRMLTDLVCVRVRACSWCAWHVFVYVCVRDTYKTHIFYTPQHSRTNTNLSLRVSSYTHAHAHEKTADAKRCFERKERGGILPGLHERLCCPLFWYFKDLIPLLFKACALLGYFKDLVPLLFKDLLVLGIDSGAMNPPPNPHINTHMCQRCSYGTREGARERECSRARERASKSESARSHARVREMRLFCMCACVCVCICTYVCT